jgi:hypothetical protein
MTENARCPGFMAVAQGTVKVRMDPSPPNGDTISKIGAALNQSRNIFAQNISMSNTQEIKKTDSARLVLEDDGNYYIEIDGGEQFSIEALEATPVGDEYWPLGLQPNDFLALRDFYYIYTRIYGKTEA